MESATVRIRRHDQRGGRHAWLQVVRGHVGINDHELVEGDGLAVTTARNIDIIGSAEKADVIVFDLA